MPTGQTAVVLKKQMTFEEIQESLKLAKPENTEHWSNDDTIRLCNTVPHAAIWWRLRYWLQFRSIYRKALKSWGTQRFNRVDLYVSFINIYMHGFIANLQELFLVPLRTVMCFTYLHWITTCDVILYDGVNKCFVKNLCIVHLICGGQTLHQHIWTLIW